MSFTSLGVTSSASTTSPHARFSLTEHCSVCVQTTFFIHLSANGQLDSLRVLATGNRAAVTTGCRCRFETLISVPLVQTESGVTSRAVGPCPTS